MEGKHTRSGVVTSCPQTDTPHHHDSAYEKQLVTKIAQGDTVAWEEFFFLYYPELTRYFSWQIFAVWERYDRNEAEEMAQETIFRVRGAAARFKGRSTVRTWVYGIAKHVFSEWKNALRRESTLTSLHTSGSSDEVPGFLVRKIADPWLETKDQELQELRQQLYSTELQKALAQLKRKSPLIHETLVLYYYHHHSIEEIAEVQGVRPGTVKSRLHRGRKYLKRVLHHWQYTDPYA